MEVALTHERADFDAVASLVALARVYPAAIPVLPISVNGNVTHFLALYGAGLGLVRREDLPRGDVSRLWLVDTDSAQTVRGTTDDTPRSIIDHHSQQIADREGVDPRVGANVTLLVERLAEEGPSLNRVEATLMLLGIYEDTGSLAYGGTTPRDLRAAAWLMEHGGDLAIVRQFLDEGLGPESRALFSALVEAVELHEFAGRTVVIATADAPGFRGELSPLAAKLADLHPHDALFLVADVGDRTHVIARSNSDGIEADAVMRALGGGGHSRAAAAVLEGATLQEVKERLVSTVATSAKPAATVADIMSSGPIRSLEASLTIKDALETARKFGHEGFPIVDDGALVGMVTRQDLDRALHHGLAGAQVRRLALSNPSQLVDPSTSVESLKTLMLDEGVGQLAVAHQGRLVGIVTRTDLLKLWPRSGETGGPVTVDLDRAFTAGMRQAILFIAAEATKQNMRAYVVGGIPRDVLLGVPPGADVDVVVEGDAVALAHRLRTEHGGLITVHTRFGTAKWTLPDNGGATVDLVSARTEYYDSPTALPGVQRGSIRSDLRRRDFTVNTLAADIHPLRFGQVLDFFGGVADIRRRQIRVLHSLSFVEDPTRILRAARLCRRLDFRMEERTATQADQATELLSRVSGARVRNELILLTAEDDPTAVLNDLEARGVLAAIHPALGHATRTAALADLATAADQLTRLAPEFATDFAGDPDELRLAAWLSDNRVPRTAMVRLALPGAVADEVMGAQQVSESAIVRADEPLLSDLDATLHGVPPRILALGWAQGSQHARSNIERYVREGRRAELQITGTDLKELGYRPGASFGRALWAARQAMLDGRALDRDSQVAVAREVLDSSETHP